jgi:hypothetical protein
LSIGHAEEDTICFWLRQGPEGRMSNKRIKNVLAFDSLKGGVNPRSKLANAVGDKPRNNVNLHSAFAIQLV